MVRMWIATDESNIFFGDRDQVFKQNHSRYTYEDMSDEMYNAFLEVGTMAKEYKDVVAFVLYKVLDGRGLSNN